MKDLAEFTQSGSHVQVSIPRYTVTAVIGHRIWLGPDFHVDVLEKHGEILTKLGWVSNE